jgi:hypothetical protein
MPPLPAPGTQAPTTGPNAGKQQSAAGVTSLFSTPSSTGTQGHSVFVTILGEIIGVSLLAIFADSGEGPGKLAVALMAGWFLVFLMANATTINQWVKDFT